MKLPNADRAVVEIEKLRDYCLSSSHPRGRHKARVFAAALGITASDSEEFRREILLAVHTQEAIAAGQDEHGRRYTLDFRMTYQGKQAVIRTLWIIRNGEENPRFTSCYIL